MSWYLSPAFGGCHHKRSSYCVGLLSVQCCLFVAEVDLVMLNGWEILFCMYEMSMQCKEKYPVLVLLQFIHASYILISQLMLPGMQSRMPDPTGVAVHIYKAKNNNMLTVLHQCCGPISLCFSCGYNILSTKTTVGLPCIWLPKAHYSYCNMVKVLVCGWMAQLYTVVNVLPVVKYCSSCKQFLHLLNTCLVF